MGDSGTVEHSQTSIESKTNKGVSMNFIERIFGISPDGGDGSTELMYFIVFVLIVVAFFWRRLISRKARRMPPG